MKDDNNESRKTFWKALLCGYLIGTAVGILWYLIGDGEVMIRTVGFCMIIGTGIGSSIGMKKEADEKAEKEAAKEEEKHEG